MAQRGVASRPLLLWALSFAFYLASAGTRIVHQRGPGHYRVLAQWMLHGQVSTAEPIRLEDLVFHGGRTFIAFPPLPAVLLLPWTAIAPATVNLVAFTAAFGAANVVLMLSFLRRALPRMDIEAAPTFAGWLTLAFAVGTPHWYLSALGGVWHTSQICGLTFLLLACRELAGKARPAVCGAFHGLAILAAPPLTFALPFFTLLLIHLPPRVALKRALTFGAPLGACVLALLWYNHIRFGAWTEFGYRWMDVGPILDERLRLGLFSWRHIPHNVARGVLGLPLLHHGFPFVQFEPSGQSLFLTSPFLLAIFWAGFKGPWRLAAWAAGLGVLGTFLCYFSTGYVQFGYRYAVEAMPFLLLLVASAFDGRVTPFFTWSIRLAIVVNLFGTLWILNWGRMAHQLLRAAGLD